MLDIYYPSLRAFVRACWDIRAYLRSDECSESLRAVDTPENYCPRRILRTSMYVTETGAVVAHGY